MTVGEAVTILSILTSVKGGVLGLAGRELSFFMLTLLVLCFGFVAKTVLIYTEVLATVEQRLHSTKAFSLCYSASPLLSTSLQDGHCSETDWASICLWKLVSGCLCITYTYFFSLSFSY